jgi:hypothetical protein
MRKQITAIERMVAEYLRDGYCFELDEAIVNEYGNEVSCTQIEIGLIPGYAKTNLDDIWMSSMNDRRLGANYFPDENLTRFFTLINMHPMHVLDSSDFKVVPAKKEPYYGDDYRLSCNQRSAQIIAAYFDLLNNFQIDSSRPALCNSDDARNILDNSFGGYPVVAGFMSVQEILSLDFDKPVFLAGNFQVGIWDSLNGSGHMESGTAQRSEFNLARDDLFVYRSKGWTPDDSCGFVRRFYTLELANQSELQDAAATAA